MAEVAETEAPQPKTKPKMSEERLAKLAQARQVALEMKRQKKELLSKEINSTHDKIKKISPPEVLKPPEKPTRQPRKKKDEDDDISEDEREKAHNLKLKIARKQAREIVERDATKNIMLNNGPPRSAVKSLFPQHKWFYSQFNKY